MIETFLEARSDGVAILIQKYADGELSYGELEKGIYRLGFKTTSLHEMIRHIKPKIKEGIK